MSPAQWTRFRRLRSRIEITQYDWYTWKGYQIPDAIKILEGLSHYDRKIDPIKAEARMTMAHEDLSDSIPVSVAAKILGFSVPEFKVGTKFVNNAEELPFGHHPRVKMYPWIRRPLARRDDIRELYYGEFGATRNLPVCRGDHHSGPGDRLLQSA